MDFQEVVLLKHVNTHAANHLPSTYYHHHPSPIMKGVKKMWMYAECMYQPLFMYIHITCLLIFIHYSPASPKMCTSSSSFVQILYSLSERIHLHNTNCYHNSMCFHKHVHCCSVLRDRFLAERRYWLFRHKAEMILITRPIGASAFLFLRLRHNSFRDFRAGAVVLLSVLLPLVSTKPSSSKSLGWPRHFLCLHPSPSPVPSIP